MKRILKIFTVCCACIALLATMLMAGCGTETTTDTTPTEPETANETETSAPAEDTTDSTQESDETAQTETDADTPKEMVSVTLNEVAHSIFTLQESKLSGNVKTLRGMRLVRSGNLQAKLARTSAQRVASDSLIAPMYVAIEEGYFAEEGIHLDLVTGFGADKVMTAVLSGEADIGFMGPETTVYTANEGSKDQVINFAQLIQRAGNFLVAREPDADFEWSKLVGKDVLGGRAGG